MQMKTFALLAAAAILLAGCSTKINTTQEIAPSVRGNLVLDDVSAAYGPGVTGPAEVAPRLAEEVRKAAPSASGGGTPVKLRITITNYDLVNAGARALAGAFAGDNKLSVDVEVVNAASEEVVGRYEVRRESNPGGYGIFYSQAGALITETAKGIVAGLYGSSP